MSSRRRPSPGGSAISGIAHFEAHKALHRDVLPQLADRSRDYLAYGLRGIFNEVLLQQTHFLVKFFHLALNDLFDHLLGLAAGQGLGAVDSVESLVVKTAEEARDPLVLDKIRKAAALFIQARHGENFEGAAEIQHFDIIENDDADPLVFH